MADIFQEDFRDFLKALNDQEVKYIMVGAWLLFFMVMQG